MQTNHLVGSECGGGQVRPVYEFKLLPDFLRGEVLRYADGAWIPNDGEHDLAFISMLDCTCVYVEHGHQKNINFGWFTKHWSAHEPRHPRGNAWHYSLVDGEKEWGGDWGRERHENYRLSRKGMDKVCSERGCASGRGISLINQNPHVEAGLVRNRNTKEVFTYPANPVCMYCGDAYKGAKP